MRKRIIYLILVVSLPAIMLMSNAMAASGPPIVWANQATISAIDTFPDLDPENSGYWNTQVIVWEHEPNPGNGDIYISYSLFNGAAGTWTMPVLPATHPATTGMDERNPAVSVTRDHPVTGREIHVVYERLNNGVWEICHTYTANLGVAWSPVAVISTPNVNAHNPAICYTEDLAPGPGGGGVIGFINQIVWDEPNTAPPNLRRIVYDAHVYDPTWAGRGYISAFTGLIQISSLLAVGNCEIPEIASVEDNFAGVTYDYYFAVVWRQFNAQGQTNIMYNDGTTITSPAALVAVTPGVPGQINPVAPVTVNHDEPDIAATQAYLTPETYYFHITWVMLLPPNPWPFWVIESSYSFSPAVPLPTAAGFGLPLVPQARGSLSTLDRPTIASKLISQVAPVTFESWICWEDSINPLSAPDIWYNAGQCTGPAPGAWAYFPALPARVPYLPINAADFEYNPELWNRNTALQLFPTVTHLVFDRNPHPQGVTTEVEYIDP